MAAGRPVAPADLALDMDGNGTLETGVVLASVPGAGDKGVERAANIRRATAYKVKNWMRPGDILQHTYGQGWRWTGLNGQELAYAAVPVWVGEGTPRDDLDVTVDWRVNGRGSDYMVFVLTRTEGNGELWNLPLIWGTAVCGNDVVFAPIARLGDLVKTIGDNESADDEDGKDQDTSETDGETSDETGDDTVANEGFGVGVEGVTGGSEESQENSEIITEGVSEGSDETSPTWNESFPVAFPESTGESTTSGGGSGDSSSSSSSGGSGGSSTTGGSGGSTSGGGSSGGGSGGGGGEVRWRWRWRWRWEAMIRKTPWPRKVKVARRAMKAGGRQKMPRRYLNRLPPGCSGPQLLGWRHESSVDDDGACWQLKPAKAQPQSIDPADADRS